MVPMDLDFEFAAALLAEPPSGDAGNGRNDALDDEAAFGAAAALLERAPEVKPPVARPAFGHRTAASTAYARKCLQAQRAEERADRLEGELKDLNTRSVEASAGSQNCLAERERVVLRSCNISQSRVRARVLPA